MFKAGTHGPLQCLILCDIDVNVMPRCWVLEIAEHILVGGFAFSNFPHLAMDQYHHPGPQIDCFHTRLTRHDPNRFAFTQYLKFES